MNKLQIANWIIPCLFLSFLSCKNGINKPEEPVLDRLDYTIRAAYESTGSLLNKKIQTIDEKTFENGEIKKDKFSSKSNSMAIILSQEYDKKQRVINMISERNGEVVIIEKSKYTRDDLLLSQMRLENNDGTYDTILYEFHYPEDRANPFHYYRTNNGERVTDYTLTKTGNTEVLESRAVGSPDYVGINTKTTIKNDDGLVIEKREINISYNTRDKDNVDTSRYETIRYKYNENGKVTWQSPINIFSPDGAFEYLYDGNGTLERKIVTRAGKPKQIIEYKRV